jgi:PPOX class probable F420-dependent enzyme
MTADEVRAFLKENNRAVLVTFRSDGSLQTSPITAGMNSDGMVVISSRETAYKVKNLRRDPRATLCVFGEAFFGRWIQIDGTATVISLPEAMEGLIDYYRRLSGAHPDWDEYRTAMKRERRVLVCIAIERVGPDRSG